MNTRNLIKFVMVFCILSTLVFSARGIANASPSCSGWSVVPSPNPGSGANLLSGVTAISASDVWAVGYGSYDHYNFLQTLIEQWNGTSWSIVPGPNPGPGENVLGGITALSSNDVWTVGLYQDSGSNYLTLIEHWDGTQWSIIPSPSPGQNENYLYGVSAVSANDIWAVGAYQGTSGYYQTLTEHWNGTSWSLIPSPGPKFKSYLQGVTAVSTNDVWAVGYYTINFVNYPLIEHWNGTQWSIVKSPHPGSFDRELNGVAAISTNDIWSVGYSYDVNNSTQQTLTEHWDGTQWSIVKSPNQHEYANNLNAVAVVSSNSVWAVGYYNRANTGTDNGQALIEHWDGRAWSLVPNPHPSTKFTALYGVAAIPGTSNVWSVGYSGSQLYSPHYTLIEYYC